MEASVVYSHLNQVNSNFFVTPNSSNSKVLLDIMHLANDASGQKRVAHKATTAEEASYCAQPPLLHSWDQFWKDVETLFLPQLYLYKLYDDLHTIKSNASLVVAFSNKLMQLNEQLQKIDKEQKEPS